jgi:hypothetical protein
LIIGALLLALPVVAQIPAGPTTFGGRVDALSFSYGGQGQGAALVVGAGGGNAGTSYSITLNYGKTLRAAELDMLSIRSPTRYFQRLQSAPARRMRLSLRVRPHAQLDRQTATSNALYSGGNGKQVKNQKQAVAIMLSEKKAAEGGKSEYAAQRKGKLYPR